MKKIIYACTINVFFHSEKKQLCMLNLKQKKPCIFLQGFKLTY